MVGGGVGGSVVGLAVVGLLVGDDPFFRYGSVPA